MTDTIVIIAIVLIFIVGPFWLISRMNKRVSKKGALFTGQATGRVRILAIVLGILFAGIFLVELLYFDTFSFLFLILALALLGYGFGAGQLLRKFQSKKENINSSTKPPTVKVTEQPLDDNEDPNFKL
jgi:hypothetical protein